MSPPSSKKSEDTPPPWAPASQHPTLSLWIRLAVFIVGWLLILIGVVGLVLPGLQGILTIFMGAALLSLVSELIYKGLRWCFRRWPKGWKRVYRFRRKMHRWLERD